LAAYAAASSASFLSLSAIAYNSATLAASYSSAAFASFNSYAAFS